MKKFSIFERLGSGMLDLSDIMDRNVGGPDSKITWGVVFFAAIGILALYKLADSILFFF